MSRGYSFIYNGIASETYNVSLAFIDEDYTNRASGSEKSIITDSIRRNPRKLYLDVAQEDVLEFGIEIIFDNPVDIYTLTAVKNWLTAPTGYAQLRICAENFNAFYYNCIFHLKEDLIFAGGYSGVTAEVECDAPWAWELSRTDSYNLTVDGSTTITFNNLSDDIEMLKPVLSFHMAKTGNFSIQCIHYDYSLYMVELNGVIRINNVMYNDAVMYCTIHNIDKSNIKTARSYDKTTTFSNIVSGATVVCDNLYGIIESDEVENIVQKFNKVFLKLPKGISTLVITGQADRMALTYENAKRLGGGYY